MKDFIKKSCGKTFFDTWEVKTQLIFVLPDLFFFMGRFDIWNNPLVPICIMVVGAIILLFNLI